MQTFLYSPGYPTYCVPTTIARITADTPSPEVARLQPYVVLYIVSYKYSYSLHVLSIYLLN